MGVEGRGPTRARTRRRRVVITASALVIAWVGVEIALPRYLEGQLRAQLVASGFPQADLRVDHVGWRTIEVSDLWLSPEIRADRVTIELRPWLLGRVDSVDVVGGDLTLGLGPAGPERPPIKPTAGALSARFGLPKVQISRTRVYLESSVGRTEATIDARVEPRDGGWSVSLAGTADRFGSDRLRVKDVRLQMTGDLTVDGIRSLSLHAQGSLEGEALAGEGPRRGKHDRFATRIKDPVVLTGRDHDGELALSLTASADDASLRLDSRLPTRFAAWHSPVDLRWRLAGAVPEPARRALVTAGIELEGATAFGSGTGVWEGGTRFTVDAAQLAVAADRMAIPDLGASLSRPRAVLAGAATIEPRSVAWVVREGSRLAADRGRVGEVRIDRPSLGLRGDASRAGGVTGGPGFAIEATTPLRVALGAARGRFPHAAVRFRPGEGARAELVGPLWWRERLLGQVRARLTTHGERIAAWGEVRALGGARAVARADVGFAGRHPRGHIEWRMAPQRVDLGALAGWTPAGASPIASQPESRTPAAEDIHGEATVSLRGRLELGPRLRGRARVRLLGGSLRTRSGVRLDGVRAAIELPSLFPLATSGEQRVHFRTGEAGPLTLGPGWIGVRAEGGSATVRLGGMVAGGEIASAPLSLPLAGPQVVALTLRGLAVDRVAAALSGRRLTGSGRLDGEATVRIDAGLRAHIQDARLHARRPGRIAVRDAELARRLAAAAPLAGGLVGHRVASALADFAYSHLEVKLRQDPGGQLVIASLRGRGRRVPQELSLVIRARGLEHATRRAVDLVRRARARPSPQPRHPPADRTP